MLKKQVLRVLAVIVVMSMGLTACGVEGEKESVTKPSENIEIEKSEIDDTETLQISIFSQADDQGEAVIYDNEVIKYFQEQYNLKFEFQYPPQGSETEQLNMMYGTGEFTDLIDMNFNTENLTSLYEEEVIYNLTPYMETYMPNYLKYLENNLDVKSAISDDNGNIYTMTVIQEAPIQWGGLVYRKDILDTMTGNNIEFPSGNNTPTTIKDWDYMLPLMKQYFDASGMAESACLILPATGYFSTGELISGFGIGGAQYVNDGTVKYGISEDNFYNYLTKMNEWYEKGYIYSDFASRTQDLFYLPNTALTYGGAAGVWFGFNAQLGGAMSLPDYNLFMDTEAISAPADTENGVDTPLGIYLDSGRASANIGWAISTACDEDKLIRIMNAFDYFYSEEGARTKTMGLSAEQGAVDLESYKKVGITNGTRKNGTNEWTDEMDKCLDEKVGAFGANRLPGIMVEYKTRSVDLIDGVDLNKIADEIWTVYGNENVYPLAVSLTPDETDKLNKIETNIQDYANPMIVKFIMGIEELTEESFKSYQEQLESLGLSQMLEIRQDAYDRYIEKAK